MFDSLIEDVIGVAIYGVALALIIHGTWVQGILRVLRCLHGLLMLLRFIHFQEEIVGLCSILGLLATLGTIISVCTAGSFALHVLIVHLLLPEYIIVALCHTLVE